MRLHTYRLEADTLCLGERIKGGLHRPCSRSLRYSTITPALRQRFGMPNLHAVGVFIENGESPSYLVYSPTDRVMGVAKIPLTLEYLTNVEGLVFMVCDAEPPTGKFSLMLGAYRSKGFGRTTLTYLPQVSEYSIRPGKLGVRLPLDTAQIFGIEIIRPVYGYLWRPDESEPLTRGSYVPSLFEDTLCRAPNCLLKEEMTWTLLDKKSQAKIP